MEEINLGRVQGLTTSITINEEIRNQINGNIDIGKIVVPDENDPIIKKSTIGDITTLATTDKSNIVAAINELVILTKTQYETLIAKNDEKENKMIEVVYSAEEIASGIDVSVYSKIIVTEPTNSVVFNNISEDGMISVIAGDNLIITIPEDMDWDGRNTPLFSENYIYDIIWINNVFYANRGV